MFTLPQLSYEPDSLEQYIDKETMIIHHTKHHQAYIDNLNKALTDHYELKNMKVDDLLKNLSLIPENIRTAVRNNGGGHANHSLFWTLMSPDGGGEPKGDLGKAIVQSFSSFDAFKDAFVNAALARFGSGWSWLILRDDKLEIMSTANQDSPLSEGAYPILGCDVWEHAYYLKYQNRRADYLAAWWNVVNWDEAENRYQNAL